MRQKEIQYSSRTRANTDHFRAIQRVRGALADVAGQGFRQELRDSEDGKLLRSRCPRIDRGLSNRSPDLPLQNYEGQSKDYDFSRRSMREHWQAGYNDAVRTLRHPEALQRPAERTAVATFDLAVNGRE